jgi:two-component system, OmpR family, response regulator
MADSSDMVQPPPTVSGESSEHRRATRVLVVEDDPQLAGMLAELLHIEGYAVDIAGDGQRGLHLALSRDYDVIVLDRGLPAVDGLDLLARLRSRGTTTPVLILSALGLPRQRVEGLDAGAEDYVSKPFDVDELLARLRALLRRHTDQASEIVLPGGRLLLESRAFAASDGRQINLSERELDLLSLLARRPSQVFSRRDLREHVFADASEDGVVDTYVHYLRRKLGRGVIRTVRGVGYQLGAG